MATKVIEPLTFELMVRKVEGADRDLPDEPRGFKTIRGDWPTVTRRANELNALQKRIQKPMYFFYPEAVPAGSRLVQPTPRTRTRSLLVTAFGRRTHHDCGAETRPDHVARGCT